MMCLMLGRLFEPYVVNLVPHLLLCFGDTQHQVRKVGTLRFAIVRVQCDIVNWISGDLLDIFESYPLLDHFRYSIFSDERNSPSGYLSYFNSDFNKGNVAYILEVALIKDYQENGVSFQRKYNKKNTSYENFKNYLIANLWLLKISEYKIRPFFGAIKEVLKLFLILFSSYIVKFIKLIFKKFK